ncbi:MAG TPA: hypothetical protein PLV68_01055 [Ilumatobacteraceae bacterium]|nr:hypothetical protein [Ilumatobacteraceae bacterium]
MKTAISVPDATYEQVEHAALRHGMNRSQFYARAAEHYIAYLDSADLTASIDAAIEALHDAAEADESTVFAVAAGHHTLSSETPSDDESW